MAGKLPGRATIWTAKRRWLGNVLPFLFWLPLTAAGAYLWAQTGAVWGLPVALLALGQLIGWLAVSFFGSAMNPSMRHRFVVTHASQLPDVPSKGTFVGFATPSFRSAVDPHEDVGLLFTFPDRLAYVGEIYRMDVPKAAIAKIVRKPNVHSWLGLGGWIVVEGQNDGKPFRLLLEPRERGTGFGNRRYRKRMSADLQAWLTAK